uniref:Caveolin n=1 Tax=Crassostrea virginica TaxID=6565 RepID=A0A8B8BZN9_CRAVI|nr:caveolin-1-like [Crassostrea virginica]
MDFAKLDMEVRDPNNVNDHLKTSFEDVIAEVDGTHSLDCIWRASFFCFDCCKGLCYNIAAFVCGILIAMVWGIQFAGITFAHVWFITPILRVGMIHCNLCQKTFGTAVNCCCAPCCEVFSLLFSNIRIEKK